MVGNNSSLCQVTCLVSSSDRSGLYVRTMTVTISVGTLFMTKQTNHSQIDDKHCAIAYGS